MFDKFKEKLKQKRNERYEFEEKKKKDYELICYVYKMKDDLFLQWQNMIIRRKKMKIIRAATESEFEEKYNEFMKTIRDDGKGRVGSLWSMEQPQLIYKEGFWIYSIDYVVFELKDGISEEEYNNVINKYDSITAKYKEMDGEYDRKYHTSNFSEFSENTYSQEEIDYFKKRLKEE